MSWRDGPMIGADTETDGPDPEEAHLVTACVGLASKSGWAPRNWLLKPDRDIPAGATAVHGVSTDHAVEHGMDRAVGMAEIRDVLEEGWKSGFPVVFFNAPFDLTVLQRELVRNDLRPLVISGLVLDPLVIDKALDKYRKGSRKLVDVAAHLGIILQDAHTADADALAAVRLVWKQALAKFPGSDLSLGETDPVVLHAWQRDCYAEQRTSFAEYRRKKGEPLDDESTDWPIRPRKEEL